MTASDVDDAKAARKAARKAERKAERKAIKKAERKALKKGAQAESPVDPPTAAAVDPPTAAAVSYATFAETPFAPVVVNALKTAYPGPTQIQSRSWPLAVSGVDLIAVAKTGSGKTLAFVLPVLHRMSSSSPSSSGKPVRGLVLSPTRELASQIHDAAREYGTLLGIATSVVYGGVPIREQISELGSRSPSLVVATPGRLVDLLEKGALKVHACDAVVLDEADRLLDMGFAPQLKRTFEALPAARQTLLYTATWPKAVRKLAASYLREGEATQKLFLGGGDADGGDGASGADGGAAAAEEAAAELSANVAVSQTFMQATDDVKDNKLWQYLSEVEAGSRVIVFATTKRRVDNLAKTFADFGTCAIHGDKQQREREASLASFVNNSCPLMFATDVAARGLDIKLVTHVVNYDMARDVESYVHRIGRTGRAGASGVSLTFWNPDYDKECAPALVKIARKAAQPVPDWLAKFESAKASKLWAVKKAEEEATALLAQK